MSKEKVTTKLSEIANECKQNPLPVVLMILFLISAIAFLILWLMKKQKTQPTECPSDKECCPTGKTCQTKSGNGIYSFGFDYNNDPSKPSPGEMEGRLDQCSASCKANPNCAGFAIEGRSYNTAHLEAPLKVKCWFKNTNEEQFKVAGSADTTFFTVFK